MAFDPKRISAVLMSDGWHPVDPGSFRLDPQPSGTDHPVVVGDFIRLPHEMTWRTGDEEIRCSFERILALKVGSRA